MNTDFTPISKPTQVKILDAVQKHYDVIQKTKHKDILDTAKNNLLNSFDEIREVLDTDQLSAVVKTLEGVAVLINQGSTAKIVNEWMVSQFEYNVFMGFSPEHVE